MLALKKLAAVVLVALALPALAAPPEPADALFAHAKAETAQEHKDVLLVFSASWCGPCKLYERFLADPAMRAIHEKAFVVVRVDVGELPGDPRHANTPGGEQLRTALGAVGDPGYPWIVLTDGAGQPVINSYIHGRTDANIGYPVLPMEIDWYIDMLRRVPALSPADLSVVRTWLQNHAPHH